ncbi:MAG TPA: 30S ribosomal protein S3, partial [Candidatus Babeliaceae bacterium]|nr:30S ribosomal protein S3 [Candidatus Babeliaceae bacterium]
MGQKVNPVGFRTGVYRGWNSRWFARGSYAKSFFEDYTIQKVLSEQFSNAEIDHIEIEKTGDTLRIVIHSARPGQVIGKKGQEIDAIRKKLSQLLGRDNVEVSVQEVQNPELSAPIVARSIADQLEKRASFKKVMKKAATSSLRAGAKGVKIRVAGRLAGAEIARDEWIRIGSTPLHTLR